MVQPFPQCDVVCFVEEMASTAVSVFGSASEIVMVIFGGLVVFVGIVLARWIYKNSILGGSGRRFKR